MFEDVGKAIIVWGVPLLGAWVLAKIPSSRKWLGDRPVLISIAAGLILALLSSATAIWLYDRFVITAQFAQIDNTLFKGADVVIDGPNNRCPPGYYAVGVRTVSVSGGNRGYLESATITCMELHFKRK
ncbi:MAG: hypothetical protein PSV22_04120 [Pseudolabrys sp.]|nr:hypothetical protein [Pseudolabrys sp.]